MKFTDKQIKLSELFSKAMANKKRIKILILIDKNPKLNVEEISKILRMHYQTGASHSQRLEKVGFIYKRYKGSNVQHIITKRGKFCLTFSEKILNLI